MALHGDTQHSPDTILGLGSSLKGFGCLLQTGGSLLVSIISQLP